jgi:CMP-N-acetylneuraminic acid synthetase
MGKVAALLIGREGSVGFPNKNIFPVLGRPMLVYPLLAAINAKNINGAYLSTDSKKMKDIAISYNAKVIDRPEGLCTRKALGEDVFVHGYKYIKDILKIDVELMVLLFCNSPTIIAETLDNGIEVLRKNPDFDSCATVSKYNMWSPVRARKIGKDGLLRPFIDFEAYTDKEKISCDRDSAGDVYFADCSGYIVRPRCLEDLNFGVLPQRWMGKKIYPLKQWGGCDIDYEWQVPQAEYWLRKHGFSEQNTPYK